MGLSIAFRIIENHNGWITVSSTVGEGSSFTLYLPALLTEEEMVEETGNGELPIGIETLLLVDDEDTILYVGRGLLERCGYTVLRAENGEEALQVYRRHKNQIQLVITDMVMSSMSGRELLHNLRELGSNMPVILTTGYAIKKSEEEIKQEGFAGFITKPFQLEEVATKVRSVLDNENYGIR